MSGSGITIIIDGWILSWLVNARLRETDDYFI